MPLVFVPTPLGNLRDVTLRALDVLRECSLLVAEDTRVARRLLSGLGLPGKPVRSYHEHSPASVAVAIVERARSELVAVVTDAGMPGVSDPGAELLTAAREAGVPLDVLPGPSAALGVAVLSGFDLRRFWFEGFAPRTGAARRAAFARVLALGVTSIWFESPQRIHAALDDLRAVAPDARVFVLREYTKHYEQHALGTPAQVAAALARPVRGEIAFAIAPCHAERSDATRRGIEGRASEDDAIDALLDEGLTLSAIAKRLSDEGYGERRALYARASERKRARRESATQTQ